MDDPYGWVCGTCGLSDVGFDRLTGLGFAPKPCSRVACQKNHNRCNLTQRPRRLPPLPPAPPPLQMTVAPAGTVAT